MGAKERGDGEQGAGERGIGGAPEWDGARGAGEAEEAAKVCRQATMVRESEGHRRKGARGGDAGQEGEKG